MCCVQIAHASVCVRMCERVHLLSKTAVDVLVGCSPSAVPFFARDEKTREGRAGDGRGRCTRFVRVFARGCACMQMVCMLACARVMDRELYERGIG